MDDIKLSQKTKSKQEQLSNNSSELYETYETKENLSAGLMSQSKRFLYQTLIIQLQENNS